MKTSVTRFLAAAFLALAWISASSTPITVSSGAAATLVAPGSPLSGSFDINAAVASAGLSGPLSISAGTLTFRFSDDVDASVRTASSGGSLTNLSYDFLGNPHYTGSYYYWLETQLVNYGNPLETASVTVGGTTSAGSSPYAFHESASGLTQRTHTVCNFLGICDLVPNTTRICSSGFVSGCTDYNIYDQTITSTSGYSGDFAVTMSLDALAITDLLADGLLDFLVAPTAGDFNFLSASLTFDIPGGSGDPGPDTPVEPPDNSVPEPASLTLVIICMSCLLAMRARRRSRHPAARLASST